ncbi:hypothetical protein BDF14DRAFT_1956084 [Spinellus fusiger]|nr:hypothetical protein BDF14DRAFT_1956084 [Spinellus fusiger]
MLKSVLIIIFALISLISASNIGGHIDLSQACGYMLIGESTLSYMGIPGLDNTNNYPTLVYGLKENIPLSKGFTEITVPENIDWQAALLTFISYNASIRILGAFATVNVTSH